jgi:hypothetical protein
VNRKAGVLPYQPHDANIGDNDRVHLTLLKVLDEVWQPFDVAVVGDDIEGDIDTLAKAVRVLNTLTQAVHGKVTRAGTEVKGFAPKIRGVSAIAQYGFEFLEVSRGREKFYGMCHKEGSPVAMAGGLARRPIYLVPRFYASTSKFPQI